MKKWMMVILMVAGVMIVSSGCASVKNRMERNGGLIATTNADYIVIVTSGGRIMDVYKLKDVYVQSEESSDGWNFIDNDGNVRIISGEVTSIRTKNSETWDKYQEYHAIDSFNYK